MLVVLVLLSLNQFEDDEAQKAAKGSGGEENGVLRLGFISEQGQEGDDGANAADC